MGRLAFLMQPDGVKRHVVTNGVYDTTDADPGAEDSGDEIRRGPKQLPLRQGQWNHCRLHLNGDVLEIHLNEQLVAAYPLPLDGDRGFGLFHIARRSVGGHCETNANFRWMPKN
jgi:hypothetical protein